MGDEKTRWTWNYLRRAVLGRVGTRRTNGVTIIYFIPRCYCRINVTIIIDRVPFWRNLIKRCHTVGAVTTTQSNTRISVLIFRSLALVRFVLLFIYKYEQRVVRITYVFIIMICLKKKKITIARVILFLLFSFILQSLFNARPLLRNIKRYSPMSHT